MSSFICIRCRTSLRQVLRPQSRHISISKRNQDANDAPSNSQVSKVPQRLHNFPPKKDSQDIAAMLSKPSWSVRSLFPPSGSTPIQDEISPKTLHHLLRLSALPLPKSPEEEAEMLKVLHEQLYFVRDIQNVDTEGIEPLQRIEDETEEGRKQVTIGLESLREALDNEEVHGRTRRPRRKRAGSDEKMKGGVEDWDVFGPAGEKVEVPGTGKFFVVRSGKE